MRLLIIEDEKSLAKVLKKGFAEQGFSVDLSFDGEDGLFLAENYPFDAILLDITLPKLDGLSLLKIADLCIDTNSQVVERAGQLLDLSAKEYEYLEYLALNQNRVVSRNELLDHLYSTCYDFDSNIIDVYISNLRRKVDRAFDRKLIHTVRGAGYRLTASIPERE